MSSQQKSTSSLAESWKEEFHKLAARFIQCRNDSTHEDVELKEAMNLATSLVKAWVVRSRTGLQTVIPESESFAGKNKGDCLSCPKCGGVLHQVTTLSCGHSFCRKCANGLDRCYKCPTGTMPVPPDQLQTNIAISTIVEKWWAYELKAVELRYAGDSAFDIRQYDKALEKYNQAAQIAPGDFTLLCNRSLCFFKMDKFEEALKDADLVIQLRPNWSKGHYRRASVLKGLGRHESALLSLLHYAAMERSLDAKLIVHDVAKELYAILSSAVAQQNTHVVVDPRTDMAGNTSREEDVVLRYSPELSSTLSIQSKLNPLIDLIFSQLEILKKFKSDSNQRMIDPAKVDIVYFECSLCLSMMLQPVSTPCGHSFCLRCLERSMDHKAVCPLCQTSLVTYLAKRKYCLTEFLHYAMTNYLPQQYQERSRSHERELLESFHQIPIYIGTVVFPTAKCQLRVSEPHYLLMIRRCLESGYREFGMCAFDKDEHQQFAKFGTTLEVTDITYLPNGNAIVNTVGVRRFKVVSRNAIDNYKTATVNFLVDEPVDSSLVGTIKTLHDRVRQEAEDLIDLLKGKPDLCQTMLGNARDLPDVEPTWITLPNGPKWMWWLSSFLPVSDFAKVTLLSFTQIKKRLEAIQRRIAYARCTATSFFC